MKKSLKVFTFLLFLLSAIFTRAHKVDEVSYFYTISDHKGFLEIHFTPKGAIDLIKHIHPELENVTVIKLEDYLMDYTGYFNEHIKLKLNEKAVRLKFLKAELNAHDATIVFELYQIPTGIQNYEIELNCFNEIYRRIENTVFFDINGTKDICYLNKETYHYQNALKTDNSNLVSEIGDDRNVWLFTLYSLIWRLQMGF